MTDAGVPGDEGKLDEEMQQALVSALAGAFSWYEVHAGIRKAVPDGHDDGYRALVWAFGYDLMGVEQVERREREGSAFGAMFEFAEGRMPPRLAEVPPKDVAVWRLAFDAVEDPKARSRLGDLLWERRVEPRPDQKARGAIGALLELSTDPTWEEMESTQGLARALELARSVSDDELVGRVVEQIEEAVREEMAVEEHRPGIPFTLLRALVDLPPVARPADLDELIALTEERYRDDPFQINTAIDLRAQLTDDPGQLRSRQVALWRKRAGDADGLVKLSFLRTALDLASTHGLSTQAEELRVEIAAIDEEELDLKEFSAEVKVPREQTERFINFFLERDDWQASLRYFGLHGPPGGEPEAVAEAVEKQMRDHPIQYLVSKMVLDPDIGMPVFEAKDDQSHIRAARAEHRRFAISLWGVFAVQILRGIRDQFDRPAPEDLVAFFTTDLISAANAQRLAEALELWWDDSSNLSAHLLAPRIEAIVRDMARQLGLAIVREPEANRPGRVRGLGENLAALKGRIGTPGWHAYLTSLLTDPLGLNLRNVIGHGLRPEIGADNAALLIHAACYLTMLAPGEQPQKSDE